jgi:hypothetical protein
MTGIEYPVVTVDGQQLTVRFSFRSEYLLDLQKVSLGTLKRIPVGEPGHLVQSVMLFTYGVIDNFIDEKGAAKDAPGPMQWVGKISRAEWPAIDAAIDEALGKVAEELRQGIQAVAPPSKSLAG